MLNELQVEFLSVFTQGFAPDTYNVITLEQFNVAIKNSISFDDAVTELKLLQAMGLLVLKYSGDGEFCFAFTLKAKVELKNFLFEQELSQKKHINNASLIIENEINKQIANKARLSNKQKKEIASKVENVPENINLKKAVKKGLKVHPNFVLKVKTYAISLSISLIVGFLGGFLGAFVYGLISR